MPTPYSSDRMVFRAAGLPINIRVPPDDPFPDVRDLQRRIEVLEEKERIREGADAARRRLSQIGFIFASEKGWTGR